MIRLPGRPWFKPHRYGFGAAPFTWEGYALTAVYIAGLGLFVRASGLLDAQVPLGALRHFLGAALILSAVFVFFAWLKTDGPWRWRWGGDKGEGA